jgi:acyl dehydratase
MQDPKDRQKVPFDALKEGDPLGEYCYELTPEWVARHREATDQAAYADDDYAPVSILAADGVNLADQFWDISASVHAGQKTEILEIPRMGDTLTVTGVVAEKFVRKGRRYVVSSTQTCDSSGRVLAKGETTGVIVYDEAVDDSSPPAEKLAPPPAIRRLGPLVREMTFEKMVLYEPPGEQNMHTDHAIAREVGLPAAIATGTQFMAYLFDLLHDAYGFEAIRGTILEAKIRLPVFANERIEAAAEVIAEDGGYRDHRVRCTTPSGDAIRGTARVPIR